MNKDIKLKILEVDLKDVGTQQQHETMTYEYYWIYKNNIYLDDCILCKNRESVLKEFKKSTLILLEIQNNYYYHYKQALKKYEIDFEEGVNGRN